MLFSPLFPLLSAPTEDGFCAPVFNPVLANNGAIGDLVGSYSVRCMIPASAMTLGGLDDLVTSMRISFQAGTTGPLRIKRAFIGHKDAVNEYAYAGNSAVQIFFDGASPGIVIPTGNQATGVAAFAWDKTSDIVVGLDVDEGLNSNAWGSVTGCKSWSTTGYDAADPLANPPVCYVKNTTLNANGNGAQGITYRARIPAANLDLSGFTGPGDTAFISLLSSMTSGNNLRISKLYIGHATASGHAYADTPVQFLFPGGVATCNVTSGGNRIVAEAPFEYDGVSDIIIGCSFTSGAGNVGHRANSSVTGENTYSKTSSTEADAANPSGFTSGPNYSFVERLEFYPRACPPPLVAPTGPTIDYNLIKRLQANGCEVPAEPSHLTKLLLHFNGNVVDDSDSAHVPTIVNGPVLFNATYKKFGSHAWLKQATNTTVLSYTNNSDWNFGSGDFTIEFWYNTPAYVGETRHLLSKRLALGNNYAPFEIRYIHTTGGTLAFFAASEGSTTFDLINSLNMGSPINGSYTFYHFAITRSGNVWRTFRNGVLVASVTAPGTMLSNTAPLIIGGLANGSSRMVGFYDEFRITKGLARWTANFTPPAIAYTPD